MLLEKMVYETGLPRQLLVSLVRTAPYRYKVYSVPKKSCKGRRTIAQPAQEVKLLQRILVDEVIEGLPLHQSAIAYRKNYNIRRNAEIHVNNNFLLKMDFRDFFPSLLSTDLQQHILRHSNSEYSEEDFFLISRVCFWKPKRTHRLQLSIGAPCSPSISNTLMYEFDSKMFDFCKKYEVAYSRYADDLTFSGNRPNVLRNIENATKQIIARLQYPRVTINHRKTVHTSKKHHRRVTGLVLTSVGEVSLGRRRKRLIRSMLHRAHQGEMDRTETERLQGILAFAMDVEPKFVGRMRKKYGFIK